MKDALLWWALALAVSNHLPASLLSPELCVLERSFGDRLGGLALSLAACRELSVRWRSVGCFARGRDVEGLCRSETDSCAGGRRGWLLVQIPGRVPGGSLMVADVVPGRSDYE